LTDLAELLEAFPILCCPDCGGDLRAETSSLECGSCGNVYREADRILSMIGQKSDLNASEVTTQDEVSVSYADARYQREYSLRYHRSVLERMTASPPPHGTVLDDGCGPGLLLAHLEEHADLEQLVGVDVSRGMLRQAQSATGTDDVLLLEGDACRLPFLDESFDVVYARGLLHHLPDPVQGMSEIHRVLKPGGTVVVLEPNKTIVSALPRVLARRGKHFDSDHKNFRAGYLHDIVSERLIVRRTTFFGYLAYLVLGFPDILDFGRFLPMKRLAPLLMAFDEALARIPGLRRLGWGIVIVAERPRNPG
jgi:ubiquinone/menaquinone biosynthesis C-methylase UbiE